MLIFEFIIKKVKKLLAKSQRVTKKNQLSSLLLTKVEYLKN
jgi:hypothetical protein